MPDSTNYNEWSILYKSAYNEDGSLFFPERLTAEFLDAAKKHQGSRFFSNQYLNIVINDGDKPFKKEWLRYYDEIPKNVYRFAFIDPAISQTDSADFTALVVVAVDSDQQWYLEHASRHKITPSNIINLIFQMAERFDPLRIGIEQVAFQEVLVYMMHEEMKKRNIWLPIEGIKPRRDQTKLMKILGLIPRFEWDRIRINKGLADFENEYNNYAGERSKHDDIMDALASIDEIVTYPTDIKDEIKRNLSPLDPDYEKNYRLRLASGEVTKP
jgi:predicted phage terminase large subunit-like protein